MSDDGINYAFYRAESYVDDYWSSWRQSHPEPGDAPPELQHVYEPEVPFGATHRERTTITIRCESVPLPPVPKDVMDAYLKQREADWEADAKRQQRADKAFEKRLRDEVRIKCEREQGIKR